MSLSGGKDPGSGRKPRDGAGGRVRGGSASAVSGRRRRARMRGIGPIRTVLHIRPGPTGGESAESCGNAPALNAVEILPCAEGPALHMGARTLKINILVRTPESCGKPRIDPRGRPSPMCNTIARPGKNPTRPGGAPGMTPTGNPAPPEPRGNHHRAKRRPLALSLLRPFPSATPLRPLLRSFFSYSGG